MEILVTGIGGASGWPEPGCRCASCLRAARENPCAPSSIVIDGRLRLDLAGPRDLAAEPGLVNVPPTTTGWGQWHIHQKDGGGRFVVREVSGGWEVTGADGTRLLYSMRPGGAGPDGLGGAAYDVAFVDLLGDPFRLGRLRAAGVITERTLTLAACADHRVPSLAELSERCDFWHAGLVREGERVGNLRYDQIVETRVLVLGGARSGKSERAELRVAAEPTVSYVATGPSGRGDPEWAARVTAHRARRPGWWRTIETTDLAALLGVEHDGVLLIDGMGTWLAAVLDDAAIRVPELIEAWRQTPNRVVAVSDEVGLSVVPSTAAGRMFRDWLGVLNRGLAAESERAELVVAGRVVPLDR